MLRNFTHAGKPPQIARDESLSSNGRPRPALQPKAGNSNSGLSGGEGRCPRAIPELLQTNVTPRCIRTRSARRARADLALPQKMQI